MDLPNISKIKIVRLVSTIKMYIQMAGRGARKLNFVMWSVFHKNEVKSKNVKKEMISFVQSNRCRRKELNQVFQSSRV